MPTSLAYPTCCQGYTREEEEKEKEYREKMEEEEEEEEEKKEEEEVLRHLSSTPLRLALRSAARLPRRAARLPRRSSGTVSPILGRG